MSTLNKILSVSCALALLPIVSTQAVAQKIKSQKPLIAVKPQNKRKQKAFSDEQILPFRPVKKRTDVEKNRLKALSFYMTGRLKQSRRKFREAYADFKKAVELDPNSVEVYQALAPLAFGLNKSKEGVKYALKAVELDPNDYLLLRRLGVTMASRRQLDKAAEYFQKAAESDRIDKTSAIYVTLNRDLVVLYQALGNKEKMADAFEVIFDARVHSENYKLDYRTRRSFERDPTTSFERMGTAFLNAKRFQKALVAFQKADNSGKSKPGVFNYQQARIHFEMGKIEQARKELQKYFDAKQQAQKLAPYELLSKILQKTKHSKELIDQLEKLLQKDKQNPHLQFYLADRYLAAKRLDDAEKLYLKAGTSNRNPAIHLGLAAVYRLQKKPGDWLTTLAKVMTGIRDPRLLQSNLQKMEEEIKKFGEDKIQVDDLIAIARKKLADEKLKPNFEESLIVAKAAALAQRTDAVIEFYRDSLKRRRRAASIVYGELGTYLLTNSKYAEAAKVFREAANEPGLAGSKPNNLFRLSQALELNGSTKEALKAVLDARKILPKVALLHFQEGWIYYHSRQWDRAVKILEQVVEDFSTNKEIVNRCKFSLSNIYVQQGHLKKGEEILEKVYEEDPDDPAINNDLGYLYADHDKHLKKAEKMIQKALKAEPENSAYLDSMGWVQYKLGKYEAARKNLKKSIEKSEGSDSTLWDHLGDCLLKLDKKEEAIKAWQKSLESAKKDIFPDTKFIEKVKVKLSKQKKPATAPETTEKS